MSFMDKVKIHYNKSLFKGINGLTESIFCAPFEEKELFDEEKFENNRFLELIENGGKYIEYTDIKNCDFVIIPYKWNGRNFNNLNIINEAKENGKKIVTLHNDDYQPQEKISEDEGYLFTTTLIRDQRKVNEFSFPAFTGDFFNDYGSFYITESITQKSIGFCGAITNPIRPVVLDIISKINGFKTNFIIRDGFWAHGLTKDEARIGYYNNMSENCFTLCMRGAGNFSYRLYETMMMGRIPIIIDSNQVFPFEKILDYNLFSIIIPEDKINNSEEIINKWLINKSSDDILDIQKMNRKIWIEYMSPLGWIKNFKNEIYNIEIENTNWSIGPDVLKWISTNLEPGKSILEFGSGYSTKYLSKFWEVCSIEENDKWLNIFHSNYIHAEIKDGWYDTSFITSIPNKIDLIIIDGPANGSRDGFYLNIDRINIDKIECSILVFDDVDRNDDLVCFNNVIDYLKNKNKKILSDVIKYSNKSFGYIKII